MKPIVISLGVACALLAGCNGASEEQLVENTVGNLLAQQVNEMSRG